MLLVHYGKRKFNPAKFKPITNSSWCKPDGGFWTSPVDTTDGWVEFCKSENFRLRSLKSKVFLKLNSKKILVINSYSDLSKKLEWKKHTYEGMSDSFYTMVPDFESAAKKYDAIYLTSKGQRETRWTQPISFYGWDCETVLLLNYKKVKQLTSDESKEIRKRLLSKNE